MFQKFIERMAGKREPVEPRQGRRLLAEVGADEEVRFTIKGNRFPGFFVIFGLFFGGVPTLMLFAILFGTPSPDSGSLGGIFAILFLIPFFLIGAGTFLTGLFLWFGKSRITVGKGEVTVARELFGKAFQRKVFQRETLEFEFAESHRTNDVASYKLTLRDGSPKNKIGIGGSLKEAELLWLEREIKTILGRETVPRRNVLEAMAEEEEEDISGTEIDPHYRSRTLRITKTGYGWEARSASTVLGAIGLMLFGSVFLTAGLLMNDGSREWLFEAIGPLRDLAGSFESSGDGPPIWFAMIFGGVGALVMLYGVFILGYRVHISREKSRLLIERRWLFFSTTATVDPNDITELETKSSGQVNNDNRYRLMARLKTGKKVKLLGFSTAADVGQIHARVSELMGRDDE